MSDNTTRLTLHVHVAQDLRLLDVLERVLVHAVVHVGLPAYAPSGIPRCLAQHRVVVHGLAEDAGALKLVLPEVARLLTWVTTPRQNSFCGSWHQICRNVSADSPLVLHHIVVKCCCRTEHELLVIYPKIRFHYQGYSISTEIHSFPPPCTPERTLQGGKKLHFA